jgi:hypothetical protein
VDLERLMLTDPFLSAPFKQWANHALAGRAACRAACPDRDWQVEALRYWLKQAREGCAACDRSALRGLDAMAAVLAEMGQVAAPALTG